MKLLYLAVGLVMVGCSQETAPKKEDMRTEKQRTIDSIVRVSDSIYAETNKIIAENNNILAKAINRKANSLRDAHQETVYVVDTVWIITDGLNVLQTINPPTR